MGKITKTEQFAASPEQVWAALTDFSRYGEWNASHVSFPDGTPELVEGATYKEKVTMMGMPGEVVWTVKTVDAPNHFSVTGAGAMETTMASSYALTGDQTSTTLEAHSEFGGAALAAIEGPLTQASEAALVAAFAKLKEIV